MLVRDAGVATLSNSRAGQARYAARGRRAWRGPTSVPTPQGVLASPDDDGAVLVAPGTTLDLDAPLTCDWRPGDVW